MIAFTLIQEYHRSVASDENGFCLCHARPEPREALGVRKGKARFASPGPDLEGQNPFSIPSMGILANFAFQNQTRGLADIAAVNGKKNGPPLIEGRTVSHRSDIWASSGSDIL